jgi:acetoin utilization deacetylase AcuC-like enzyme
MKTAFHIDELYLGHRTPAGHPERVERMEALLRLASRADELGVSVLPARRQATLLELARVHTPAHIDMIAATARQRATMLDPDTFTAPESYEIARYAAGSALDLVDRVMAGEFDNAFAAVRPPGHHAESARAMGFCLFNNVAVAAAHALARHGLERVMVVDWDVHHGNGTQEIFWNDPRVLFVSLHQFPLYPGTGTVDEVGGPQAGGRTINVPMTAGFGDAEWTAALRRIAGAAARMFSPQLVLLSAGFDAHARDPLGGMRVSTEGFAAMADEVLAIAREHAEGRLVAVLEGGYDVEALGASVEGMLRRMAGVPPGAAATDGTGDAFERVLADVRSAQAPHGSM